ncbi:glycoside hydrolase family 3 C-terminal domain-containing protein [Lentisphaerota bacterium WC36G]|nr:glycoside hydrolase family 3 C-terminal domain-containing protein [Lentisphaerae bacterium WC36]
MVKKERKFVFITLAFSSLCSLFAADASYTMTPMKDIYHKGWIDLNKNGKKDIYEDQSKSVEERVADLLSRMNVNEKTCQMATLYGYKRVLKDAVPNEGWKNKIWKDGIGAIDEHLNGFLQWGRQPLKSEFTWPASSHTRAMNEVQKWFIEETRLGIPADFTNEGIRGVEAYKATNFPTQLAIGQTWNRALVRKIGEITATEGRLMGYTNIYSPILDVGRDQRWGRYEEVYSESPYMVAQLGIEMAKGLQKDMKVASTAKHYCLYSNNKGAREGFSRVDPQFSPREGENIHMYPFKEVIQQAGILGVMSSYNDYDGVPVQGSHYYLTKRLRDDFGFKGYVVSDSDAVIYMYNKHRTAPDYKDAVRQSVIAGLNVRCTFRSPDSYIKPLRELIAEKQIPMEQIDRMVADVLSVKFKLGLFDQPYVKNLAEADKVVNSVTNNKIALQASRESLVLLKNKNNTLPLKREDVKSIAVIGPNADDAKYALTHYGPLAVDVKTVLDGLNDKATNNFKVNYAKGCNIVDKYWPKSELIDMPLTTEEQKMIDEAVATANKSDVVVAVVGGNGRTCGENKSRTSLKLPGRQLQLLKELKKTNKPMIVVVISGRPLAINWTNANADAIIQAFYPGSHGGTAVADVIFGDYNPGGKLSVTVPKTVGQIPLNFPCKPSSQVAAGAAENAGALYPFGYGLSFTKFKYSNLKISPKVITKNDNVTISFDVTNTGKYDGDEIVQLYTRDVVSSVTTYEQNLRGFERLKLKKGEIKNVSFTIRPKDLQLLNEDMKWVVEPGQFNIMIGASSADIKLKGNFTVVENSVQLANLKGKDLNTTSILDKMKYVRATNNSEALPNAFDNDQKTCWSTSFLNDEIVLTMNQNIKTDSVSIHWGGNDKYEFEIKANAGGGQWVTVYKGTTKKGPKKMQTYRFKPDGIAELKIIVGGDKNIDKFKIIEIQSPAWKGND